MSVFVAGYNGVCSFGGTSFRITAWKASEKNNLIDVTGAGIPTGGTLAGFEEFIKGVTGLSGSFDMIVSGSSIPSFKGGDEAALNLYGTGTTMGYTIPKALIGEIAWDVAVKDAVKMTVNFVVNGEFTKV